MDPMTDFFVVGTDTGVGKSMVSLLLMQLLFKKGRSPFYLKPFQTGCVDPFDDQSDAGFIYNHTAELKGQDPSQSVVYCFPNPKAPYFSANDAGTEIDLSVVRKVVAKKKKKYSPLVLEGAGGLLVPVTRKLLMLDAIKVLGCRPLLVARAGLGTINHTLLSIESLRRRRLEPLGVIFVNAGSIPGDQALFAENIEAVRKFGDVKIGGLIGRISDFNNPPASAYAVLEKFLP